VAASGCCGYTPRRSGTVAGFCNHKIAHATYPGRVVCAERIGAAWAVRTEQDVPYFPCSTQVYEAGAITTATVKTVGTTVPDTSCHSPASWCRSRCSRMDMTHNCSGPTPASLVRPNPGVRPSRHRRHQRPRLRWLSSNRRRHQNRPGRSSRHHPHRFHSPQRAHRPNWHDPRGERMGRCATGGPGSPAGGPDSPIG
jgi:hypothetical protein